MTNTPKTRLAGFVRPRMTHLTLNLIGATYILAVLNSGFWQRMSELFGQHPVSFAAFAVAGWALTLLLVELLGPGALQKPVLATLILIAAAANYYERAFGVLIDREMVRNVLETTVTESKHLMTFQMVWQITLLGVLPAALVFVPVIRRRKPLHQIWRWPVGIAASFALLVGALLVDYKSFSAALRERHDLMGAYQPGATINAVRRFASDQWTTAEPVAAPYGTDATPGPLLAAATKPVLLVYFVGETARAQNFGLNGYARDTTPQLRKRNVINFSDVSSCGTSTAVSVPCMFSHHGMDDYSRNAFLSSENLLDILNRAGFDVQWFDNNTGDQKVAKRLGFTTITASIAPEACIDECTDEAFLPIIQKTAETMTQNTVLVLHMIGSHGPAYYLRYSKDRALFQPECTTTQFANCAPEDIVNAYDNSIVETDHVLAQTIDLLAASDRILPAMVYVSDHGESLGENGLYLHAAPMFMAPAEQRKVPMVMWMDSDFTTAMQVNTACLSENATQPISHDNLFHSVLGLLNVSTTVRDAALDLTAPCKLNIASN
ncbi:phosphoethanolamine transferase [Pseudotabrizicola sp. L79]|uniref:phosphoethanolamine transferase n=1 Tax=Pseudotabrizicola sp. L79 TaxID=3118402 RepID=UPI002F95CA07